MVLLDDNFASIVYAIRSEEEFLTIFKSHVLYSCYPRSDYWFGLLPAFYSSLPILLMPMHIVFMELIIDPVCSIALNLNKKKKAL